MTTGKALADATVAHVTTVHRADDPRISLKECRSLSAHGAHVVLVATLSGSPPPDGVSVVSIPSTASRLRRMTSVAARAFFTAARSGADVIHIHDPEMIPWAMLLRLFGKRVIFDAHENLVTQILEKDWIPAALKGLAGGFAGALQRLAGAAMNGIVVATPAIAREFPRSKTHLVQNMPLADELSTQEEAAYEQRPNHIAYVGAITQVRGISKILDAFSLIEAPDVVFDLVGPVRDPIIERRLATHPDRARIVVHGFLGRADIRTVLSNARIGLVLLQPVPSHIEAQPNKLFEYMSAGVPVVASDFPLWRQIVGGASCGLLADPTDPLAISRAISWLLSNRDQAAEMGANGRRAVERRYNWESESRRLVDAYRAVLKR